MTHEEYLEAHHETANGVLAVVAQKQGTGDHEAATELVTRLRTRLDELWEERRASAEREVAP